MRRGGGKRKRWRGEVVGRGIEEVGVDEVRKGGGYEEKL